MRIEPVERVPAVLVEDGDHLVNNHEHCLLDRKFFDCPATTYVVKDLKIELIITQIFSKADMDNVSR